MAAIQDYISGKVCEQIKKAFSVFESVEVPLNDTEVGKVMLNNVNKLEPKKLTIDEVIKLIQESKQCAIGERVCRSVHTETPLTESVFLDDLAAGMVEAGKARFATKEEATDNMKKYQKNPIIVSKVSGKYSEICPTWPKKCLYWNMEKHKLKCINR
jgi:hypothetical protein